MCMYMYMYLLLPSWCPVHTCGDDQQARSSLARHPPLPVWHALAELCTKLFHYLIVCQLTIHTCKFADLVENRLIRQY